MDPEGMDTEDTHRLTEILLQQLHSLRLGVDGTIQLAELMYRPHLNSNGGKWDDLHSKADLERSQLAKSRTRVTPLIKRRRPQPSLDTSSCSHQVGSVQNTPIHQLLPTDSTDLVISDIPIVPTFHIPETTSLSTTTLNPSTSFNTSYSNRLLHSSSFRSPSTSKQTARKHTGPREQRKVKAVIEQNQKEYDQLHKFKAKTVLLDCITYGEHLPFPDSNSKIDTRKENHAKKHKRREAMDEPPSVKQPKLVDVNKKGIKMKIIKSPECSPGSPGEYHIERNSSSSDKENGSKKKMLQPEEKRTNFNLVVPKRTLSPSNKEVPKKRNLVDDQPGSSLFEVPDVPIKPKKMKEKNTDSVYIDLQEKLKGMVLPTKSPREECAKQSVVGNPAHNNRSSARSNSVESLKKISHSFIKNDNSGAKKSSNPADNPSKHQKSSSSEDDCASKRSSDKHQPKQHASIKGKAESSHLKSSGPNFTQKEHRNISHSVKSTLNVASKLKANKKPTEPSRDKSVKKVLGADSHNPGASSLQSITDVWKSAFGLNDPQKKAGHTSSDSNAISKMTGICVSKSTNLGSSKKTQKQQSKSTSTTKFVASDSRPAHSALFLRDGSQESRSSQHSQPRNISDSSNSSQDFIMNSGPVPNPMDTYLDKNANIKQEQVTMLPRNVASSSSVNVSVEATNSLSLSGPYLEASNMERNNFGSSSTKWKKGVPIHLPLPGFWQSIFAEAVQI